MIVYLPYLRRHDFRSGSRRVWGTCILPGSPSYVQSHQNRGHCGLVWHRYCCSAKASSRLPTHETAQSGTVTEVDVVWSKRQPYRDANHMRHLAFHAMHATPGIRGSPTNPKKTTQSSQVVSNSGEMLTKGMTDQPGILGLRPTFRLQ